MSKRLPSAQVKMVFVTAEWSMIRSVPARVTVREKEE